MWAGVGGENAAKVLRSKVEKAGVGTRHGLAVLVPELSVSRFCSA